MINILEIDSIMLEFGDKRILSDIYMRFEEGKVVGILGRNGAGKSCLLKILFGTLKSQYSNIRLNQNHIKSPYLNRELIRFLPQYSIFPGFARLSGILNLFNVSKNLLLTEFPEFEEFINAPIRILSFGQKRIFENYVFLKTPSKFLVLDEPFSYLMPIHVEKIRNIITQEKKSKGIIITDHLYKNVLEISDEMYLIKDGQSHKIGDQSELKDLGYLI